MTIVSSLSASGGDNEREQSRLRPRPVDAERKEPPLRALADPDTGELRVGAETVREVVSRYLRICAKDKWLPPAIARFLDTYWRSYMANLYVSEGERSEAWSRALENTVKLVWSVQPKTDDKGRRRLYGLMPELLQWLHQVLDTLEVPVPEEDRFFAELAQLHAAALSNKVRARPPEACEQSASSAAGQATADPQVPPVEQETTAGGVASPAVAVRDKPAGAGANVREKPPEAAPSFTLPVGSWVELQGERGKRVLRLEWVSTGGGVYHFRDQKRGDSLCLTAARCEQLMRENAVNLLK